MKNKENQKKLLIEIIKSDEELKLYKMEEKFDYNSIPVEFCSIATCCSLSIVEEGEDDTKEVFCKTCGGTKITKAPLATWEHYYFMAHGKKFLDE